MYLPHLPVAKAIHFGIFHYVPFTIQITSVINIYSLNFIRFQANAKKRKARAEKKMQMQKEQLATIDEDQESNVVKRSRADKATTSKKNENHMPPVKSRTNTKKVQRSLSLKSLKEQRLERSASQPTLVQVRGQNGDTGASASQPTPLVYAKKSVCQEEVEEIVYANTSEEDNM